MDDLKFPLLLTREQAANFLGVDPKSFDKYIRSSDKLKRFMVGKHERYTVKELTNFILEQSIN
ncbi:MAG: helix-turn-helix domain-containing protein [Staphylococcus sp.]|uniref:helix-turn-helix domain-containing protein n=1 Tax=Staphylococcus TaxID=1279 RepID=UPI000D1F613D|nr:helix-turn-helix domain-containing protein [Staphylococcus saprophyticus]PTK20880.1 DNA-binding protein [Staphylococcus saprophyticus]